MLQALRFAGWRTAAWVNSPQPSPERACLLEMIVGPHISRRLLPARSLSFLVPPVRPFGGHGHDNPRILPRRWCRTFTNATPAQATGAITFSARSVSFL